MVAKRLDNFWRLAHKYDFDMGHIAGRRQAADINTVSDQRTVLVGTIPINTVTASRMITGS
jgi:hypothetical protein